MLALLLLFQLDSLDISRYVADLVEAADIEEEAVAEAADRLFELALSPLDLNTATFEELLEIPAMSSMLARALVRYRERHGELRSIHELLALPGIDPELLRRIAPFVETVSRAAKETSKETTRPAAGDVKQGPPSRAGPRRVRMDFIQRWTRRLDLGRGYSRDTSRTTYEGGPTRLYSRLQLRSARLSVNATMEKDPGEPFRWKVADGSFGYDFVSLHAAYRGPGLVRTLIVGDFAASAGHGLLLSGTQFRAFDATNPGDTPPTGFRPYASAGEDRFFRGVAVDLSPTAGLSIGGFVSRRRKDGRMDPDSDPPLRLSASGLHRTPTEREARGAIREAALGFTGGIRTSSFQMGGTLLVYRHEANRTSTAAEQPHFVRRRQGMLFLAVVRDTWAWKSELSGTGRSAAISSAVDLRPAPWAGAGLTVRRINGRFSSPFGAFVGSSIRIGAEASYDSFVRLQPTRQWLLTVRFLHELRTRVTSLAPRPIRLADLTVYAKYAPRAWTNIVLQYRMNSGEGAQTVQDVHGRTVRSIRGFERHAIRTEIEHRYSSAIRLRWRAEVKRYTTLNEHAWAYLLFQDLRVNVNSRVQADIRYILFDAAGSDVRLYSVESDLIGAPSAPGFSDRGYRYYVLLRVGLSRRTSFEMKYSRTKYPDRARIGSGLDEMRGNTLREMRAQVRWRFS